MAQYIMHQPNRALPDAVIYAVDGDILGQHVLSLRLTRTEQARSYPTITASQTRYYDFGKTQPYTHKLNGSLITDDDLARIQRSSAATAKRAADKPVAKGGSPSPTDRDYNAIFGAGMVTELD